MTLAEKLKKLAEQRLLGELSDVQYDLIVNRLLNGATTIEIFGRQDKTTTDKKETG